MVSQALRAVHYDVILLQAVGNIDMSSDAAGAHVARVAVNQETAHATVNLGYEHFTISKLHIGFFFLYVMGEARQEIYRDEKLL